MDAGQKEYHKWQRRTAKGLPKLAERVFALRNKSYLGCGLHYSMEKKLGSVIQGVMNYDSYSLSESLVTQIITESLYDDVSTAEKSIKEK